ncbi:MAG: proline--tRNA ligase, partial [Actinomycetota bacterium]|nr:proline--tRNA ligase [Actinomycetota bacterium]
MTRMSSYFLPTERQPPADAEAISHKLMVRAGLIRQVGSGLWSWLPAGWRVHQRIVQIVREEMDAIGGQEMMMPVMHPAEPWRRTGRYGIDELFKLQDRRGADLVLAMTHEEIVTGHVAAAVQSYRGLPLVLYHFQIKERDEQRPRAGVLRTREFIMKDAYTFDRDAEGLEAAYQRHAVAYARMCDRCGLEWYRVRADVGMMGGHGSDEYMAPCAAGENDVAIAPGYAANVEVASADAQPVSLPAGLSEPELVPTPGATTIEAVTRMLEVPAGALLKAFPIVLQDGGEMRLVMVRGDHRVNEIKLRTAVGTFRPATADEVSDRLGPPGYIGPVGARMPVLLDAGVSRGAYVTGANRPDAHLRGVEPGRDFSFETADVREVLTGD